jgi:hypothetical protein
VHKYIVVDNILSQYYLTFILNLIETIHLQHFLPLERDNLLVELAKRIPHLQIPLMSLDGELQNPFSFLSSSFPLRSQISTIWRSRVINYVELC